ncbi:MAG: hypothetical protein KR126chlam6_01249 [Candidatus Anoxychlamydiales bacterium]|nr:hypothetical protein [Candidatus Anoxychlamydiales bacterium]
MANALPKFNPLKNIDKIKFIQVNGNSQYFPIIIKSFKERLEHLYGNQDKGIEKVKKSDDRICEVLFVNKSPVGLIVLKKELQNEYGISNSLELKTLFLINPEKNSGQGYGTLLIKRILIKAKKLKAQSIYCTCAQSNINSFLFIQKMDFTVHKIISKGDNKKEFVFKRNLK